MKTVVAQGEIDLNSLNDGYDITLSPNSCIIKADYDGKNPVLTNAFSDISISQGEDKVSFTIKHIASSQDAVGFSISNIDNYTKRIQLTSMPEDVLEGYLMFEVAYRNNIKRHIFLPFTVIRETSMLDWVIDWNSNKTEIAGSYVITPKIFAGTKDAEGQLTGVYIGPNSTHGAGLYGYKSGSTVFSIDENGAEIGGWSIFSGGIQSQNGRLKILSSGNIASYNAQGEYIWNLASDGSAILASGNALFDADGSIYLKGTIEAASGVIGGWTIGTHAISSKYMMIDSASHYIGLSPYRIKTDDLANEGFSHRDNVAVFGGVCLHYTSSNSYGIEGYLPSVTVNGEEVVRQIFKIGDNNHIAGWNFDKNSLWRGEKQNTSGGFTSEIGDITIGSEGLRGYAWYIDSDGPAAFSNGLVEFGVNSGSIVGWKFLENKLYSRNVTLVSQDNHAGLYLCATTTSAVGVGALADTIHEDGGIYIRISEGYPQLVGVNSEGAVVFQLNSTTNGSQIGGWSFDSQAIYSGKRTTVGFTEASGDITISSTGIRGFAWQLNSSGSGAVAGGNLSWTSDGHVSIGDGKLTYDPVTKLMSLSGITMDWGNIENAPIIPSWVIECEETKTQIGESYMISPRIFSGTKNNETGALTGILQGNNCWTDDTGVARSGIYGFVDDQPVFELDPINHRYKFSGEVDAKTGKIGDLVIRDNKLIGLIDGVESVEISIDEIPGLGSMFTPTVIPGSSDNFDDVLEYDFDEREDVVITSHINTEFVKRIYVPYDSIINVNYQHEFTVLTGTFGGSYEHSMSIRKNGEKHNSQFLPAGYYDVVFNTHTIGNYHGTSFTARVGVDIQGITYSIAPQKSAISCNGILSMHAADNYMYYQKDYGWEVRFGDFGFRVVANGVQKYQNGGWQSI